MEDQRVAMNIQGHRQRVSHSRASPRAFEHGEMWPSPLFRFLLPDPAPESSRTKGAHDGESYPVVPRLDRAGLRRACTLAPER
jgi:hypothetical protein